MMRENDVIDILQQEIKIPAVVQKKTNLVFRQIQAERTSKTMKNTKRKWKTIWLPIAAAVLALGTTVCAAVYVRWSRGLETQLQVTDEQKHTLEEAQIAAPVSNSVTEQGITVTAMQTIVDSRFAYLAFQVEGYHTADGVQPDFENMTLEINGNSHYSMLGGGFFNGLQSDGHGNFTYLDGSPALENADGSVIEKYTDENGNMEYTMLLMTTDPENSWIGKPLHLELHNLGTVYKAAFTPDIDATWTFDFTLQGSDKVRTCKLSETLGDSGATVIEAEISPISIYAAYDMPMQTQEIDGVNENGEKIQSSTFVEAPKLSGVRLKDGTLLTQIANGGSEGYSDSTQIYKASFATSSILDPEQVDALLFIKSYPEGDTPFTEENLYIVPIE
ncbi:MAG: DUF4179 domain-containing protein [Lachnospiraceae bacterium]|nr:DUF4179 domain-containing protein [Lachnospiraceae bacterium]